MPVGEMLRRMDPAEFMHWLAIDIRDPLPDRRMDWHFAALTAALANMMGKRETGGAFRADEFRLFAKSWDQPPEVDGDARAARNAALAKTIMASVRAWNAGRADER